MTRVLVLGGAGMMGHKAFQILSTQFRDTFCTVRNEASREMLEGLLPGAGARIIPNIDAREFGGVGALLTRLEPDVVINCIGIVKQRAEAQQAIPTIAVNSLFPHQLGAKCREIGSRLIHLSTDCVFSGLHGSYTEDDPTDPQDLYGQTKVLGELRQAPFLTLRTSIVGRELRHHESLLEWLLTNPETSVHGYRQAWFSGLTTNRLALVLADLVLNSPDLTGLFHVAGPRVSKFDLLMLVKEQLNLSVNIEPSDDVRIDRSLVSRRFEQSTGYKPPTWEQMIAELAADPTDYRSVAP